MPDRHTGTSLMTQPSMMENGFGFFCAFYALEGFFKFSSQKDKNRQLCTEQAQDGWRLGKFFCYF
jgi:hypothetical protein